VRRHTVASDACPLSLAPGTPRGSVGQCAQPTTVTLESERAGALARWPILPALVLGNNPQGPDTSIAPLRQEKQGFRLSFLPITH
jgi:hypothetical protein